MVPRKKKQLKSTVYYSYDNLYNDKNGKRRSKMGRGIGIAMLILIVLLALAVGYITYDKYSQYQLEKKLSEQQQGFNLGYQQAIVQLMNNAATCQQVPVTFNNQTINIIAVECLQRPGA